MLRTFGVAVVERNGAEVSRSRALRRTLILWSPVWFFTATLAGAVLVVDLPQSELDRIAAAASERTAESGTIAVTGDVVAERVGATISSMRTFFHVLSNVCFALFLFGVVWAVIHPQRGPHDWLAGTWLVPR